MIHPAWLLVLLTILSVARLTRLITDDAILDTPRGWILERPTGSLAYFIRCPWCVSIWVGAGAGALVYFQHRHWPIQVALLALAASYLTGVLATIVNVLERLTSE